MSSKAKRSLLSLPPNARKSKKSTKQAIPQGSQQHQATADMELLDALMGAPTGEVIPITDAPAAPPAAMQDEAGNDQAAAAVPTDATGLIAPDNQAVPTDGTGAEGVGVQEGVEVGAAQHVMAPKAAEQGHAWDAAAAAAHQHVEPAPTFSDQTLVHKPAAAASPSVQCTGKRSRRACSNKAQQRLLLALGDSDGEHAGDEVSPEEKPAGRRAKKAKRDEDSDFEMDGHAVSSEESEGEASEGDDDFDAEADEETPKKKKKKGKGKAGAQKGKQSGAAAAAGLGKVSKKASARARASTGSVANTAGAAAGSGRDSVKGNSQRTSLGSVMPSEGPVGHKRPSGRAASTKAAAAAVGGLGGCSGGVMPAPAARTPLPGGMGRGALSGSSCAVGRPGIRGPRSGAGVRPASLKAVSGGAAAAAVAAAAAGAESAAPQQQEEGQQQEAWEAATTAGLSDMDDKENAGAAEAAAAPVVRQMPAASKAVTAVSNAGPRPAASAVSCRGPGLSRGFVSEPTAHHSIWRNQQQQQGHSSSSSRRWHKHRGYISRVCGEEPTGPWGSWGQGHADGWDVWWPCVQGGWSQAAR